MKRAVKWTSTDVDRRPVRKRQVDQIEKGRSTSTSRKRQLEKGRSMSTTRKGRLKKAGRRRLLEKGRFFSHGPCRPLEKGRLKKAGRPRKRQASQRRPLEKAGRCWPRKRQAGRRRPVDKVVEVEPFSRSTAGRPFHHAQFAVCSRPDITRFRWNSQG